MNLSPWQMGYRLIDLIAQKPHFYRVSLWERHHRTSLRHSSNSPALFLQCRRIGSLACSTEVQRLSVPETSVCGWTVTLFGDCLPEVRVYDAVCLRLREHVGDPFQTFLSWDMSDLRKGLNLPALEYFSTQQCRSRYHDCRTMDITSPACCWYPLSGIMRMNWIK